MYGRKNEVNILKNGVKAIRIILGNTAKTKKIKYQNKSRVFKSGKKEVNLGKKQNIYEKMQFTCFLPFKYVINKWLQ